MLRRLCISRFTMTSSTSWHSMNARWSASDFMRHCSCCSCCRTVFIPRHCFSFSSDTQLKMYSIETRQQVRGINLSSMVGCFAHKFEFCVTPSSYKPTRVEYMLCINILTLSLSVKRWGLPLDWLTLLAKCWTISKSDT